jgi:hypothetical protein
MYTIGKPEMVLVAAHKITDELIGTARSHDQVRLTYVRSGIPREALLHHLPKRLRPPGYQTKVRREYEYRKERQVVMDADRARVRQQSLHVSSGMVYTETTEHVDA